MKHNNRTKKGRAAIDRAVAVAMGSEEWTRGTLVFQLPGLKPRMVSDSLRRLVAAGKVRRKGPSGRVYKAGGR